MEEQNRAPEGTSVDDDIVAVDKAVMDLFLRALELEPTHRWALINLGLHLHARSRNDEVRVKDTTSTICNIQIIRTFDRRVLR